ncbi:MAG TPA: hypothetical protein VF691_05230, partial [Cytophagaceae bacterium]
MKFLLFTSIVLIFSTFRVSATDYYWVGGTGKWSEYTTHWATSSGGSTFHVQVPTSNDNVFFDKNSFNSAAQSLEMDIPGVCATMNWTGSDFTYFGAANGPTMIGSSQLEIFGSLILAVGMRPLSYVGTFRFLSSSIGNTIDTKGIKLNSYFGKLAFSFEGTGTWTFSSNLNTLGGIDHRSGTLNFGSQSITMGYFYSNSNLTRNLNLNSSKLMLTGPSQDGWNPVFWNLTLAGLMLNPGTSNILVDFQNVDPAFEDRIYGSANFLGGGATYYNITSTSRTNFIIEDNNVITNLRFNGAATVRGSNTIKGSLTLTKGNEYIFQNSTTQFLSNGAVLTANGDCSGLISIRSSGIVDGESASFFASTWAGSTVNYTVIFNMNFSAAITANNSIDNSLNTGITFNSLVGKDLYWIMGTGNWNDGNKWSFTSGGAPSGCVPTPLDNVYFDANSFTSSNQQVIIDSTNAYCRNMSWLGASNNPTFVSNGVLPVSLNVYGSLAFIPSMANSLTKPTNFWGSAAHTVTSAGQSFTGPVTFTGTGTYSLNDDLQVRGVDGKMGTGVLSLFGGTLTTNNFKVTAKRFYGEDKGLSRTLNLGSSLVTINSDNPDWSDEPSWFINSNLFTLNSGTSTINVENLVLNVQTVFKGGGLTYYNVNFLNTEAVARIADSDNSFNNLSFSGNAKIEESIDIRNSINFSPGKSYTVFEDKIIRLIGGAVLNANGDCSNYIIIKSSGDAQGIISKTTGSVNVSYVNLQNAQATGGALFTASNSIDQGGNTGWVIGTLPPRTLYWVGGSGNWSDMAHWSLTSGGIGGACPPTLADNVFFNASSFTGVGEVVTIDINPASFKNMDWTGALYNPSLAGPKGDALYVYGSIKLIPDMTVDDLLGNIHFKGTGTNTIFTGGRIFQSGDIYIESTGGTYTFLDSFSTSNTEATGRVHLISGTLNTNGVDVNFNGFNANYTSARTLNLGSSKVTINGGTCWCYADWDARGPNFNFNAGTSTLILPADSHGGGGNESYLGDKNYNTVTVHLLDDDLSKISIYGNNTFRNLRLTSITLLNGSNTFVDSLHFTPDRIYVFQDGTTQTFGANTHIGAIGTGSGPIYVQSVTAGSTVYWTKPSGRVCADFIYIRDIDASGGASFTGGGNANDQGGNAGWNFDPYPVPGSGALAGADTLCPGESTLLTFALTGALPKTIIYSDGFVNDTIKNVFTNLVTRLVTPASTVTYRIERIDVEMCFGGIVAKSGTALIRVLDGTAGLWTG